MSSLSIPSHWFYRYKLYHLLFWFVYHYLWWTIAIGNPLAAASNIFFSPYSFKFLFYVLFQALGVYFNLYYLIPTYLEKGRYIPYLVLVILSILGTACLIIPGYYVSAWWNEVPVGQLFSLQDPSFFHLVKSQSLPSTAASMTLAMSIKLTKNWLESQRRERELEKEKLETELKFLKSQFNPHFLFNTINSIFVLIHKNPDRASESLAKFSNLMRYQLYDCNAYHIPLTQEINYLEDYMELEQLRHGPNFELVVHKALTDMGNKLIAPFLLMPFVENACKHVSQHREKKNWIHIHMDLDGPIFHFCVVNSSTPDFEEAREILPNGGLGLKNVQRRLDLLYRDHYELKVEPQSDQFSVELKLTLSVEPVPVAPLKSTL